MAELSVKPLGASTASGTSTAQNNQASSLERWGIYTLAGKAVFDVDSCVDLKYGNGGKVSAFPVEKGSFVSYNKVQNPFQAKLRLSVGGPKRMAAFMAALETETAAANLYNVITPEAIYKNVTIEKFDYARSAEQGRSKLVAEITLVEIREVTPAYSNVTLPASKVKNAKSASPVHGGKVQPQDPSSAAPSLKSVPMGALWSLAGKATLGPAPSNQVLK